MERRPFDQSADPAQHITGRCRHRTPEQFDGARVRRHQSEQQPDRRRLARTVRTEESIDRTARHGQVDRVDGHVLAEPAGEAMRRDGERRVGRGRRQRRGDRGHKPCPLDATFWISAALTGPMYIVPSSAMKIDRSAVVISSPPGTGVAMSSSGPDRRTVICGPLDDSGPLDAGLEGSGPFDDSGRFAGSAGTALVIFTTSVQPVPSS